MKLYPYYEVEHIFNHLYSKYNKMNTEMVLVGIILFSAMIAGGVKIWLNKRKEQKVDEFDSDVSHDSTV